MEKSRLGFMISVLLFLPIYSTCGAQIDTPDDDLIRRIKSGEVPVADFEVSLPGGGILNRTGATGIPDGGIVLTEDLALHSPSTVTLRAGTRIEQRGKSGWSNLFIIGPDGARLSYTPNQIAGVRVVPDEEWSKITVTIPPLGDNAQAIVDGFAKTVPDINGLFAILQGANGLTDFELRRVISSYLHLQHPRLSAEEIVALRADLRRSISNLQGRWTVECIPLMGELSEYNRPPKISYRFLMDGAKLYLESNTHRVAPGEASEKTIRAYDGAQEREYSVNESWKRGSIIPFRGRSAYFNQEHILWVSMLIDGGVDLGEGSESGNNLSRFHFYPLEKLVEVDGVQCLPCITFDLRVLYLDPARGYCLVADKRPFDFDPTKGCIVPAEKQLEMTTLGHDEFADGLWLPKTVRRVWTENGQRILQQTITYEGIEINQEIADNEFVDVVPDGVLLIDLTSTKPKAVRKAGGVDMSGRQLAATSALKWWIIPINGIALAIGSVFFCRSYWHQ